MNNTFYMKTLKCYFVVMSLLLLSWSCTQDEGFGGNSHINGQLLEKYYNEDFSVFQYEKVAQDEDVFILFGEDKNIGENTATSYTGNFQFKYLWPGNYQLYYYSKDSASLSTEKKEIIYDITLEKNETKNLGTIYAYKTLSWNEGSAKIKGKIMLTNYKDNTKTWPNLDVDDTTPAQEQEVYITYNNADFYTDRVRTQGDGTFEFSNLIKGKYTIFVYSEDVITRHTNDIVKEFDIEITELNQVVVIDEIMIEKI